MDRIQFFLILFFFIIFFLFVSMIVIPIFKKHKRVTGSIVNFDVLMRKFVYKVPFTKAQISELLRVKNIYDELEYTFDENADEIRFSENGSVVSYQLFIDEREGFSVLQVNQISVMPANSQILYNMNPFWVKKLNAEIVPFFDFGVE